MSKEVIKAIKIVFPSTCLYLCTSGHILGSHFLGSLHISLLEKSWRHMLGLSTYNKHYPVFILIGGNYRWVRVSIRISNKINFHM